MTLLAVGVVALLSGARDTETVAASAPTTTVDEGRLRAGVRLGWIVTMRDPVPAGADATACVRAGAACDLAGMLAADSARLQAGALGSDLLTAIDPSSPGFDPLPSDAVRRARAVAALAQQADRALASWLASGCGSQIDGLPVAVRPIDCDERGDQVVSALEELRAALSAWPR